MWGRLGPSHHGNVSRATGTGHAAGMKRAQLWPYLREDVQDDVACGGGFLPAPFACQRKHQSQRACAQGKSCVGRPMRKSDMPAETRSFS
eukprot:scaffold8166_cov376-Prasinococcus_capsulatus_cf.AAC.2